MIVDTSALVSVLLREPGFERFAAALESATMLRISAASYVETAIVVQRLHLPGALELFDATLRDCGVVIEPVTAEQAVVAREAYLRFGKGSGSAARLNFGDCFAYALSRVTGDPLLFKGDDFTHTDVVAA